MIHVASLSGGKDSVAMTSWAIRSGIRRAREVLETGLMA